MQRAKGLLAIKDRVWTCLIVAQCHFLSMTSECDKQPPFPSRASLQPVSLHLERMLPTYDARAVVVLLQSWKEPTPSLLLPRSALPSLTRAMASSRKSGRRESVSWRQHRQRQPSRSVGMLCKGMGGSTELELATIFVADIALSAAIVLCMLAAKAYALA